MNPIPLQMFDHGFTGIVPVIPPGAPLSPGSKVSPTGRGKTPGRKLNNGTWVGMGGWQTLKPGRDDVEQWVQDGANIGLLAEQFPAVDIDCLDEWLSNVIESVALSELGPAPVRFGRAPKRLLMYRLTGAPFQRLAAIVKQAGQDTHHLVEILGAGRQYVVYGTHPSGSAYRWDTPSGTAESLLPEQLTPVTLQDIERFLGVLQSNLEAIPGLTVEMVGDGKARQEIDPAALRAPSWEALEEAVRALPNDNAVAETRNDYLRIGYAIKASSSEDDERGYHLFAEWAARWPGNERYPNGNDPDVVRQDWRRMRPPYAVGWGYLAELARRFGFKDAPHEFDAVEAVREQVAKLEEAPALSDRWLANRVIDEHGDVLRFIPSLGRWHVWDGAKWEPDAVSLAEHLIGTTLERLGAEEARKGATPKDAKESLTQARRICSAYVRNAVRQIVETDPRIAIRPEAFDSDPLLLNTPGGVVDLTTGTVRGADPRMLCSLQTAVAPTPSDTPVFDRFLDEVTEGDVRLQRYLQKQFGYCLTGEVTEQTLHFFYGTGKNGKSVLLNLMRNILGTYGKMASMDTFMSSTFDRHPTDMAMLMGARLVTAIETKEGRHWDEARLKTLTGGDAVTARFMRQDFFTYQPQFKLVFSGNNKPEIHTLDEAMRRRVRIIPFRFVPEQMDSRLPEKLMAEAPGILAWMIAGYLAMREEGLTPPDSILLATNDYFDQQDAVQRWIDEDLVIDSPNTFTTAEELFESWREWCGRNGETQKGPRALTEQLVSKGYIRRKGTNRGNRRWGFEGLGVRPSTWEEAE